MHLVGLVVARVGALAAREARPVDQPRLRELRLDGGGAGVVVLPPAPGSFGLRNAIELEVLILVAYVVEVSCYDG